ncbi:FecR family protein [Porticoccaceae bacterium]|jgi:transmembrane sensor|nr:FecR family protein [Porticoccaceae bacterium]MDA7753147.1 FecR family protein [bacterium]MDA9839784.1 FecR family protein [Porticoccaceae bacterium]MDB2481144.1 FecR family protein [Porticoccaceae bacterium]MDC0953046.1 FecR family protein [Porticoccaceae bacterium]
MSKYFMQLSDQINEQAAEWFTLMQSADVSAEDRQELNNWLSEHSDHREAYRQIELVWQSIGDLSGSEEGFELRRSVEPFSSRLKTFFAELMPAQKYAISFTIVCVAVTLMLLPESNTPATTYYSTGAGEIKTITLVDNSEITLGAKSQISTVISDVERSVNLISGEAFFDVAKDRQKPFFVITNNLTVEVVGTQFNVRQVRDSVSVAVAEGIVNIFSQGVHSAQSEFLPALVLMAGQGVVKEAGSNFEPVTAVPASDAGAWRMGRLVYRDISLANIVADAGRYIDGKIVLQSDDLADVKVTMTLRTDQVDQLPQMLSQTLPLEVHVISDNITLLKN